MPFHKFFYAKFSSLEQNIVRKNYFAKRHSFEKSFNEFGAKKFISPRINTVPNLILKSIVTSCSCERLSSVLNFKKRILDQKLQIILKISAAQDFDANLQEIININLA